MNNVEFISDRENQIDETQLEKQQDNAQLPMKEEDAIVQSVKPVPTWVKVSGGTMAGLLLGASSVFLTSSTSAPTEEVGEVEENEEADNGEANETGNINSTSESMFGNEPVPIATGVNDDMSFSEAFAAARHEVGAGGAFEWHGNIYGTYYAEEWNNMSAEQQADYHSHVVWQPRSASNNDTENLTADATEHNDVENENAQVVEATPASEEAPVEVEVLGVVHDNESGANIVGVAVDNQNVFLVDVDNDNSLDLMVADVNNDGQITEDEIADISGQGLTVEQFISPADPMADNSLLASNNEQLPDYTNDANIDGYV